MFEVSNKHPVSWPLLIAVVERCKQQAGPRNETRSSRTPLASLAHGTSVDTIVPTSSQRNYVSGPDPTSVVRSAVRTGPKPATRVASEGILKVAPRRIASRQINSE